MASTSLCTSRGIHEILNVNARQGGLRQPQNPQPLHSNGLLSGRSIRHQSPSPRHYNILRTGALQSRNHTEKRSLRPTASLASNDVTVGSFRAGQKRAEVRVPSLVLEISSGQVIGKGELDKADVATAVDAAVGGGVTMVILKEGGGPQGEAMELFEAACQLKSLLRGRVPLLVYERADIAAAAMADGVALSDRGLPAVAARRMMESTASASSSLLPLIARTVTSATSAAAASAIDGADVILMKLPDPAAQFTLVPGSEESPQGEPGQGIPSFAALAKGAGRDSLLRGIDQVRLQLVTVPLVVDAATGVGGPLDADVASWGRQVVEGGGGGLVCSLRDLLSQEVGVGVEEGIRGRTRAAAEKIIESLSSRAGNTDAGMDSDDYDDESLPDSGSEHGSISESGTGARWGEGGFVGGQAEEGLTEARFEAGAGEEIEPIVEPLQRQEVNFGGKVESQGDMSVNRSTAWPSSDDGREGALARGEEDGEGGRKVTEQIGVNGRGVGGAARASRVAEWEVGVTARGEVEGVAKLLLDAEKGLLEPFLELLREAAPEMAEIQLLEDSLARLSDPFLVVVVGEFNSGKSMLVNALLGDKFLKSGVVPTTNEITVLRHMDDSPSRNSMSSKAAAAVRSLAGSAAAVVGLVTEEQRHPDGHMMRFIPAPLLRQLSVVDTPGTNVILERQQRLTEEFVPQADLVLFVMSCDRALTDSEVSFLRYIRQWGKKVMFALNKVDALADEGEVEEVLQFVTGNVRNLLGVDSVVCFPVSSRLALGAKRALAERRYSPIYTASGSSSSSSSASEDLDPLAAAAAAHVTLALDPSWQASGFAELESFIFRFLEGGTDAGAERRRLKLDTPLGVAAALTTAVARQLAAAAEAAARDATALQAVTAQLAAYSEAMKTDSMLQRARIDSLVRDAAARAEEYIDETLTLSNTDQLLRYVFSSTSGASGSGSSSTNTTSSASGASSNGSSVGDGSSNRLMGSGDVDEEGGDSNAGGSSAGEGGGERPAGLSATFQPSPAVAAATASLPLTKEFRTQIVGSTVADVRRSLVEHHVWLRTNNARQLKSYTEFVAQRWPSVAGSKGSGNSGEESDAEEGDEKLLELESVALLEGFDTSAAALLLEEEMRQSVLGTATNVGLAGISASLLTSVLDSGIEDFLALALCSVGGAYSIIAFPQRRETVKKKVRRAATGLVKKLDEALEKELQDKMKELERNVGELVGPYKIAVEQEATRVASLTQRLEVAGEELEALRQKVRNLGS